MRCRLNLGNTFQQNLPRAGQRGNLDVRKLRQQLAVIFGQGFIGGKSGYGLPTGEKMNKVGLILQHLQRIRTRLLHHGECVERGLHIATQNIAAQTHAVPTIGQPQHIFNIASGN